MIQTFSSGKAEPLRKRTCLEARKRISEKLMTTKLDGGGNSVIIVGPPKKTFFGFLNAVWISLGDILLKKKKFRL